MSKMPDQGQTSLSEAILTEIPRLRAYARLMTNDVSIGDRGVAETLQQAPSNIEHLRGACESTFSCPSGLFFSASPSRAVRPSSYGLV
jgi:DNA-directed RNA polymerase specialized sigma24 family protein